MIMIMSVAEWITNFLVFGISCAVIVFSIFGLLMTITLGMNTYEKYTDN